MLLQLPSNERTALIELACSCAGTLPLSASRPLDPVAGSEDLAASVVSNAWVVYETGATKQVSRAAPPTHTQPPTPHYLDLVLLFLTFPGVTFTQTGGLQTLFIHCELGRLAVTQILPGARGRSTSLAPRHFSNGKCLGENLAQILHSLHAPMLMLAQLARSLVVPAGRKLRLTKRPRGLPRLLFRLSCCASASAIVVHTVVHTVARDAHVHIVHIVTVARFCCSVGIALVDAAARSRKSVLEDGWLSHASP